MLTSSPRVLTASLCAILLTSGAASAADTINRTDVRAQCEARFMRGPEQDQHGRPGGSGVPMPRMQAPFEAQRMAQQPTTAAPPVSPSVAPMPSYAPPPPHGVIVAAKRHLPPGPDRERYPTADPNPVKVTAQEPVSTFSSDVDTAAYANVRRFILQQDSLPPRDAVRTEEMINYFDYDYPLAEQRDAPFRPTVAIYPTPWNKDTRLLQIGIRGYDIPRSARPAANLVFLMDTSGSMMPADRLPLAKTGICMLMHELDARDRVSLVVYAGSAGVVLEPTSGAERETVLAALDRLNAGGSTAGGQGIELAYKTARKNFNANAVNRIILASDGDFNVGIADPSKLGDFVARERSSGVFLTVLGFGGGNYNDAMMQKLAQLGNGVAAYIDDLDEAHRVLVDKMTGSLFPIAKDVKIQVEFNPGRVREYRLIGYETRLLRREDFANDAVDAGDVGAGHSVTALYEIVPVGSAGGLIEPLRYGMSPAPPVDRGGEYAHLRIRYKLPREDTSRLIERPVTDADVIADLGAGSADLRFAAAVAGFAQMLRGEPYLRDGFGADHVIQLASAGAAEDPIRRSFVDLVTAAKSARSLGTEGRSQR